MILVFWLFSPAVFISAPNLVPPSEDLQDGEPVPGEMSHFMTDNTAGSNGIDIVVSRHHTVSVSNFQSIRASTVWLIFNVISGYLSLIIFPECSRFSLYRLVLQRKYRVACIKYNYGIVRYQSGIDPVLTEKCRISTSCQPLAPVCILYTNVHN